MENNRKNAECWYLIQLKIAKLKIISKKKKIQKEKQKKLSDLKVTF